MYLRELIKNVQIQQKFSPTAADLNLKINSVTDDSRRVHTGGLFVAIPGTQVDATRFVAQAIQKGAAAIVVENRRKNLADGRGENRGHSGLKPVIIWVNNARRALAQIAANYYKNPSRKLKIIAVTGTNGKTTITYLVESILIDAGYKVGVMGTIGSRIGKKILSAGLTTPAPLELQKNLAEMSARGVTHVVMEASSHALAQERLAGVELDVAVFTNLTREHLDYHRSMRRYVAEKQKLFTALKKSAKTKTCAVVNADDPYFRKVLGGYKGKIITFGINRPAKIIARNIIIGSDQMCFTIKVKPLRNARPLLRGNSLLIFTPLLGVYNASNFLAAFAAGKALGIGQNIIHRGLEKIRVIPGRLEEFSTKKGFRVFVDFAHTPDALEKLLKLASSLKPRKIILVFGCTGSRDQTKRPVMGNIASRWADITIVTTDDPHAESPAKIIDEVAAGWGKKVAVAKGKKIAVKSRLFKIVDRKKAINKALNFAEKGDIVLIAGRGHEKYQDFNGRKVFLDDREVVRRWLLN